jgi:hypothetical protein
MESSSNLSRPERLILGWVVGLLAFAQISFVILLIAAVAGVITVIPMFGLIVSMAVGAGIYIAVMLVVLHEAHGSIPEHLQPRWNRYVRTFGPLALFALWWRFLR